MLLASLLSNLIIQAHSINAAHRTGDRVTVEESLRLYSINEAVAAPEPRQIGILNDVLTAG